MVGDSRGWGGLRQWCADDVGGSRRGRCLRRWQTAVTVTPGLIPAAPPVQVSAGRGLSVDLSGVTVRRDGTTLLDNATLHVGAGEMAAIVGPSGSGKTSLVKLLLGEYKPDSGTV